MWVPHKKKIKRKEDVRGKGTEEENGSEGFLFIFFIFFTFFSDLRKSDRRISLE